MLSFLLALSSPAATEAAAVSLLLQVAELAKYTGRHCCNRPENTVGCFAPPQTQNWMGYPEGKPMKKPEKPRHGKQQASATPNRALKCAPQIARLIGLVTPFGLAKTALPCLTRARK